MRAAPRTALQPAPEGLAVWPEALRETLTDHAGGGARGAPVGVGLFSTFVFIAVFVDVNLFIAVVINNLESVKHEQQIDADRESTHHELLEMIETLRERLGELEDRLRTVPPQRSR